MKYTDETWDRIEQLRSLGLSWDEVAEHMGGPSGHSLRNNYRYHRSQGTGPHGSYTHSITFVPDEYDTAIPVDMPRLKASIPEDVLHEAGKEFDEVRRRLESFTPEVQKARLVAAEHKKLSQKLLLKEIVLDDVVAAVRDATKSINKTLKLTPVMPEKVTNKKLTAEILFSDSQIGKLIKEDGDKVYYDTSIALHRIAYYAEVVVKELRKKIELGYEIEKVVIALLGDIIESDSKHETSYHGVDTSTSEQISNAITGIYNGFLMPLFQLGIPTDVVCIAGNHDWDRKGMSTTRAGRTMLTYPIYVALEEITKGHGLKHVKFIIPAGSFAEYKIYDHHVIYEHGYQLGSINPEGIAKLRHRRTDQTRKHIDYFRVGDKHQQFMLDNGKIIVNGAMFHDVKGVEYSGQLGFSSTPGQYLVLHTPRDDVRNSIYSIMQVQLAHVR